MGTGTGIHPCLHHWYSGCMDTVVSPTCLGSSRRDGYCPDLFLDLPVEKSWASQQKEHKMSYHLLFCGEEHRVVGEFNQYSADFTKFHIEKKTLDLLDGEHWKHVHTLSSTDSCEGNTLYMVLREIFKVMISQLKKQIADKMSYERNREADL